MVNAQEWLDKKYPEKLFGTSQKKIITILKVDGKNLEGSLKFEGFSNLERLFCDYNYLTNLEIISCPKLKIINCSLNNLIELKLVNLEKLTGLYCAGNRLEKLNIKGCPSLKKLNCSENLLTKLDLSKNKKLEELKIRNNNFSSELDLSFLSHLVDLRELQLGNDSRSKGLGICNHFTGSLLPLKDCSKLKILNIDNTDIDLSLKEFPESAVKKIVEKNSFFSPSMYYERTEGFEFDNIQEYIEKKYPEEVEKIDLVNRVNQEESDELRQINGEKLTLKKYLYLKELAISNRKLNTRLTYLDLSENINLEKLQLHYFDNELSYLDLLKQLPCPEKLTDLNILNISDNSFSDQNFEKIFPRFINLEKISIEYSNFSFLKCLQDMKNLKELDISNTNISGGLEYLPDSLEIFYCSTYQQEELNKYAEPSNHNLVNPLRDWKKNNSWKRNAQEWLDNKYYKREEIKKINLSNLFNEQDGELTVSDFPKLVEIKRGEYNDTPRVGKIIITNCQELKKLDISRFKSNKEIDLNDVSNLVKFECYNSSLMNLDVSFLTKLEKLDCSNNQLVNLKINDNLRKLNCGNNSLDSLDLSKNRSLEELNIENNRFSEKKLDFLQHLNSLETVNFSTNHFIGSLEPLKHLKKLKELSISNTDVDHGLEYLPSNLRKIYCNVKKPEFLCVTLQKELIPYKKRDYYYYYEWRKDNKHIVIQANRKISEDYQQEIEENKKKLDSSLELQEEWESRGFTRKEIEKWIEAGFSPYEVMHVKEWEELGFTARETKKLKEEKELENDDYDFAYYLKNQGGFGETKSLDILRKEYYEEENEKSSQIIKIAALTPPELKEIKILGSKNIFMGIGEVKNYDKIQPNFSRENFPSKILKEQTIKPLPTKLYNIKTRKVELVKDGKEVKNYATLSYVWDEVVNVRSSDDTKEEKELKPAGRRALYKAIKVCRLSEVNIGYLWMDQLCIDQNDTQEKNREVPKMRQYYSSSDVTLIAINSCIEPAFHELSDLTEKDARKIADQLINISLPIIKRIVDSKWFSRSWTFQEGWLSKQTIFMFDDCLVDGRILASVWKLKQTVSSWKTENCSKNNYNNSDKLKDFWSKEVGKVATPLGWTYYEKGYTSRDIVYLGLNEVLKEMKNRGRSLPIDGIYSILGLLPYGHLVKIDYSENKNHQYTKEELRKALSDLMRAALKLGHGDVFGWHGKGSRIPGLCWTPQIDSNGSTSIEDYINVSCIPEKVDFKTDGIELTGSEYIITSVKDLPKPIDEDRNSKSNGRFYKIAVKVKVNKQEKLLCVNCYNILCHNCCEKFKNQEGEAKVFDRDEKKIGLMGTKETLEAISKGNALVVLSKGEWRSVDPFAILVSRVRESDNIRHRVGLVEFLDGTEEELKGVKRKKIIIGQNNSWQDQSQPFTSNRVNPHFTFSLIQRWTNHGFAVDQCRNWINTKWLSDREQTIHEPEYYACYTPESLLNHGEEQQLREEYRQLQSQIEIPPKK